MAGPKLDGAGIAKMATLESANALLVRLHSLVESYALELKRNQSGQHLTMQIRRVLPNLVSLLKGQFGMISDQAAAVNLAASRGASEQMRLRGMREGVATLRQALEIAEKQVRAQHTTQDTHGESGG